MSVARDSFWVSMCKCFATACLFYAFVAAVDGQTAPDIREVIKRVSVDNQPGAILDYTYNLRVAFDRHKFGGRRFTKMFEAILPSKLGEAASCSHPLVLIEDSERMLTPPDIQRSREDVAEQLQKMEKTQGTGSIAEKCSENGGYWNMRFSNNTLELIIDLTALLKTASFSNPQPAQLNGVKLLSVDFAPEPAAGQPKPLSYFTKLEGRVLIDETANRIVRVEGFAPGAYLGQVNKAELDADRDAVFIFSQVKVAEGFWFPSAVRLDFSKHPEIFDPVEISFSFSNYKRSRIDVDYKESTGDGRNQ